MLTGPVWHPSWGNMNFSRIGAGITKGYWVTIKGYLSYILAKFEDLVPLKKPKKEGFMKKYGCHCNRILSAVSAPLSNGSS